MTSDTAATALALALAAARAEGREVRSIKDLLCDGCGEAAAMREGLCHRCADEMTAHYAARSAFITEERAASGEGGAEYLAAMYDDAESAAGLAGMMPDKH